MTTAKRQLHLGAFMRPTTIHTGAWRYPSAYPDANFNLGHIVRFAQTLSGPVYVSVRFYLYGAEAASSAGEVEKPWQTWLDTRFPSASAAEAAPGLCS